MAVLEFWYEFASTYSYPAATRIERLAQQEGVDLRWRPFLLGPILKEQGLNDSPFNIFAAKGRYMWRDLARICEGDGLPLKLPPVRFPQNGLKAARLALVGEARGWTPSFTRAVFAANYAEQKDIGDDATLGAILASQGVDAEAALAEANTPARSRRSSGLRPPRLPRAACSVSRPSPLATSCSGATTGSRRRSPGLDAVRPRSRGGRWRAASRFRFSADRRRP
jgi:2-hydroxychromene-2-carboxylate isomerase